MISWHDPYSVLQEDWESVRVTIHILTRFTPAMIRDVRIRIAFRNDYIVLSATPSFIPNTNPHKKYLLRRMIQYPWFRIEWFRIRCFMYPFFHKNKGNMLMVYRRRINNWQAILLRIALCNFQTTYYMNSHIWCLAKIQINLRGQLQSCVIVFCIW